jgi:hypothetical protein
MRSALLQWGVIALIAIVPLLAFSSLLSSGLFTSPGTAPQEAAREQAACSGLGPGGFYQEPLSGQTGETRTAGAWTFTIEPIYRYRIVGKVVGKDLYSGSSPYDLISPMDIAIANGDIIGPELFRYYSFYKTPRHVYSVAQYPPGSGVTQEYENEHISNNHLIFTDDYVYARAQGAAVNDFVVISGSLVSVTGLSETGWTFSATSSITRYDRGENACELVYVESFERLACS